MSDESRGLAPQLPKNLKRLILGSLPGKISITEQQYYAHPRNIFWSIMAEYYGFSSEIEYNRRIAILKANNVGLWDSIEFAHRKGSLDSAIENASIQASNIGKLIQQSPNLTHILFNGKKSYEVFRRHIQPHIPEKHINRVKLIQLPSTSPANASIAREVKIAQWLQAMEEAKN